jgi:hypothetical protein
MQVLRRSPPHRSRPSRPMEVGCRARHQGRQPGALCHPPARPAHAPDHVHGTHSRRFPGLGSGREAACSRGRPGPRRDEARPRPDADPGPHRALAFLGSQRAVDRLRATRMDLDRPALWIRLAEAPPGRVSCVVAGGPPPRLRTRRGDLRRQPAARQGRTTPIVVSGRETRCLRAQRIDLGGASRRQPDRLASRRLGSRVASAAGARSIREGISPGWTDRYPANYHGQSFDLTGLRGGLYVLAQHANPLLYLRESDYANNSASALLRLSWRDGRPSVRVLRRCAESDRCRPRARPAL